MSKHNFVICHKPGAEMPVDFLSRNIALNSSVLDHDLHLLQLQDEFIADLIKLVEFNTLPANGRSAHYLKTIAPSCVFENDLLWRQIFVTICLTAMFSFPLVLADDLIHDNHNALLSGHKGITQTKECLFQSYFWPNMEDKIMQHVRACHRCQICRTTDRPRPPLLTSMPQCTSSNQRKSTNSH
jgi:hypothetical protein